MAPPLEKGRAVWVQVDKLRPGVITKIQEDGLLTVVYGQETAQAADAFAVGSDDRIGRYFKAAATQADGTPCRCGHGRCPGCGALGKLTHFSSAGVAMVEPKAIKRCMARLRDESLEFEKRAETAARDGTVKRYC